MSRVVRERAGPKQRGSILDTELNYAVFPADIGIDELAIYDEQGEIFISEKLVQMGQSKADLVVFHEQEEIRAKRAGTEHSEAHRSAYVSELLAARKLFGRQESLDYLHWRIGSYPESKGLDVESIVSELSSVLNAEEVDREAIYAVIRKYLL